VLEAASCRKPDELTGDHAEKMLFIRRGTAHFCVGQIGVAARDSKAVRSAPESTGVGVKSGVNNHDYDLRLVHSVIRLLGPFRSSFRMI
jgi:hypothetical protein